MKAKRLAETLLLSALFLSLATGKWGSWIGIPNHHIFLFDLLFISGCFIAAISGPIKADRHSLLSVLVLLYCAIEFLSSNGYSVQLRLRDLAPFIYLAFVPLIIKALENLKMRRFISCIRWASVLNAIWANLVSLGLIHEITCANFCGVPIFAARTDHSSMVFAIGIIAWADFPRYQQKGNYFALVFLLVSSVLNHSRAGLLAVLFAVLVVLAIVLRDRGIRTRTTSRFLLTVLIIFPAVAIFLPAARLLPSDSAISRAFSPSIILEISGTQSGTARARIEAQSLLLHWVSERNEMIFGVGPGTEMVLDSGAVRDLSGQPDVRSPHSWPIGAISRFGVFGFILWLSILLIHMRRKAGSQNYRRTLANSFTICILIVSLFGVIIESPFGSLPLAIFLGLAAREVNETEFVPLRRSLGASG